MASSTEQTVDPEVGKLDEEAPSPPPVDSEAAPPAEAESLPPPEDSKESVPPPPSPLDKLFLLDTILRVLLFASVVVAIVVLITSSQTKAVPGRGFLEAKFEQIPGLIYFVSALAVVGFWALISALSSVSLFFKPIVPKRCLLYFVFLDVISLGLAASASGTAGEVGYIGLKGNDHALWGKICFDYDKFCEYVSVSVALSLLGSILLVLLISLSVLSLLNKT